jgi:hypothetical protein
LTRGWHIFPCPLFGLPLPARFPANFFAFAHRYLRQILVCRFHLHPNPDQTGAIANVEGETTNNM